MELAVDSIMERLRIESRSGISQAFAGEIFRVFANEHPNTSLIPINMVPEVDLMVKRSQIARIAGITLPEIKSQASEAPPESPDTPPDSGLPSDVAVGDDDH
jgi:hypothetical protein